MKRDLLERLAKQAIEHRELGWGRGEKLADLLDEARDAIEDMLLAQPQAPKEKDND